MIFSKNVIDKCYLYSDKEYIIMQKGNLPHLQLCTCIHIICISCSCTSMRDIRPVVSHGHRPVLE